MSHLSLHLLFIYLSFVSFFSSFIALLLFYFFRFFISCFPAFLLSFLSGWLCVMLRWIKQGCNIMEMRWREADKCLFHVRPWPLTLTFDTGQRWCGVKHTFILFFVWDQGSMGIYVSAFSSIYTNNLIYVNGSIERNVTMCSLQSQLHAICHCLDYSQRNGIFFFLLPFVSFAKLQHKMLFLNAESMFISAAFFVLQPVFTLSEMSTTSPFWCLWSIWSIKHMIIKL